MATVKESGKVNFWLSHHSWHFGWAVQVEIDGEIYFKDEFTSEETSSLEIVRLENLEHSLLTIDYLEDLGYEDARDYDPYCFGSRVREDDSE